MTVRLTRAYGSYPNNALFTGSTAVERQLVTDMRASTDLTGGTAYVPPTPDKWQTPVSLHTNDSGDLLVADNRNLAVSMFNRTTGATTAAGVAVGSGLQFQRSFDMGGGTSVPLFAVLPDVDTAFEAELIISGKASGTKGFYGIFRRFGSYRAGDPNISFVAIGSDYVYGAFGDAPGYPLNPGAPLFVLDPAPGGFDIIAVRADGTAGSTAGLISGVARLTIKGIPSGANGNVRVVNL